MDVGKVVKVEPLEDGSGLAQVTMEIKDEGLPIKRDAAAEDPLRLFLEGNYFVDLQPGPAGLAGARRRRHGARRPDGLAGAVRPGADRAPERDARGPAHLPAEYSTSLKREGAAGFNQAIKHWEDAYRNTSQVNDATLGQKRHDLSRVLDGQAKVFGALSKDEDALEELVTDLNRTIAAFAAPGGQPARRRSRELRDVFREGRPALASLNEALPEIRGFARDALPGARSSSPTLDAQLPFIKQARRLVSERRARAGCRASCARPCPTSRG